jgi:phage head maturation protease
MDELITRAATFEPETFDAERNTVRVIFSTGADVRRRDAAGEYIERLSLAPEAVDLSAFRGAPVLNNHDHYAGVEAILGVVEDATVDGSRGEAVVRFGSRPEVQGVVADVRAGVIRNVSVGYTVEAWREMRENGARLKIAERWTPRELSFVPLGADPGARVRNYQLGGNMQHTETNSDLLRQARNIAAALALPEKAAEEAVAQHQSLDAVRTALIKRAADEQPLIDARAPAIVTRDHADGLIERMADGLASRVVPGHKPEAGRQYAYYRLSDYARELLRERGLSTLGSPAELLARAMHTTSDFAVLLQEVFNKALFPLRTAPSPITQVFRRVTMADFRSRHILEVSDGPALERIYESGQVTFGTIDARELASYRLASYAKGFSISFQTLVNDDVGALNDISAKMARGARQWFTSFLVDTIIANPALADGIPVFHANHGNLAATGAAVSDAAIAAARLAIRTQTDLSGNPIGAAPRYILVPAAAETAVDKLLATLYPTNSTEAETAARGLTPLVEPRLDAKGQGTAWYVFCSPDEAPVFEYAELQGYEGPRVESRPGWTTLGTEFRVVWHLGAGAIDYRGAFKNPGA